MAFILWQEGLPSETSHCGILINNTIFAGALSIKHYLVRRLYFSVFHAYFCPTPSSYCIWMGVLLPTSITVVTTTWFVGADVDADALKNKYNSPMMSQHTSATHAKSWQKYPLVLCCYSRTVSYKIVHIRNKSAFLSTVWVEPTIFCATLKNWETSRTTFPKLSYRRRYGLTHNGSWALASGFLNLRKKSHIILDIWSCKEVGI